MRENTCPEHAPAIHDPPYGASANAAGGYRGSARGETSPDALLALYRSGLTLRAIAARIGRTHEAVRYHLKKLPAYRGTVTRILVRRVKQSEKTFAVTRTRESGRRLKHALAMLRQKRPAVFARLLAQRSPSLRGAVPWAGMYRADCPKCGAEHAVFAWRRARTWQWHCSVCEAAGDLPARGTLPAHSAWTNASNRQQAGGRKGASAL